MQPRFLPIIVDLVDVEALRFDGSLQDRSDASSLSMDDDFAMINILFQFPKRRQMTDSRVKCLSVDIKNLASVVFACPPPPNLCYHMFYL